MKLRKNVKKKISQRQKRSETSNYFSLSHEKGTYKDGTFVSGHQTWAEIVDEYFDTDKKFAEGIKDLSNEDFQNNIKTVLDKRFNIKSKENILF